MSRTRGSVEFVGMLHPISLLCVEPGLFKHDSPAVIRPT